MLMIAIVAAALKRRWRAYYNADWY